jgi:glycerol uptake facilitator-like aquaporin
MRLLPRTPEKRDPEPRPAHLVDAFVLELLASALLCATTLLSWTEASHVPPDNWAIEFCSPVALLCILLCMHDGDGIFPDLSPLVTAVQIAMGAYHTWSAQLQLYLSAL